MNVVKAVVNSAKKSWNGEEKLWKVFWLWGIVLYITSNIVGLLAGYAFFPIRFIVGILGLIFIFIYPIILVVSAIKCAKNTSLRIFKFLTFSFIPIFIYAHVNWSFWIFLVSIFYIKHLG